MATAVGEVSWERMIRAVEKVRERLLRASSALDAAGIPYAVAGGNAVAAWVSRVDEAAVRNTRGVDLILRRSDFDSARRVLEAAGLEVSVEAEPGHARDTVHILFAPEKVRSEYTDPVPDVAQSERSADFSLVELEPLVRMKLTSFRDKDRVHLRDLIDVGLVDAEWRDRFPPELAARLDALLADPEG